jgi:hypothetical protein
MLNTVRHSADETFTDHRSHRTGHETKLEGSRYDRHTLERAGHDDERVALVGLPLGLIDPFSIAFAVLETLWILRLQIRGQLVAGFRIEKHLQALACADA